MKYAVIEIRLGGAELLISETANDGAISQVLRALKPFALISYVKGNKLSPRGIEKLAEVINEFKGLCTANGVEKIQAIALNSLKALKNTSEILDSLKETSELDFELLPKSTLAHCDMLAAREFTGKQGLLIIDSGSGSTQLIDMNPNLDENMLYLGLGGMKLSKKFVKNVLPSKAEVKAIEKYITKKLDKKFFKRKFEHSVLIGNTSYSLAKIYADYFDEVLDENLAIGRKKLKDLLNFLINNPQKFALILKNAPEKINTIIANILIIKEIMGKLKLKEANVRDYGIIDGYMCGMINHSLPSESEPEGKETNPQVPVTKNKKSAAKKPIEKTTAYEPVVESETIEEEQTAIE